MSPLARQTARLMGIAVASEQPLGGGDLSAIARLILADGRAVIAKTGAAPPAEAGMLRALAAACMPVPDVLGVDETVLILSECKTGGGLEEAGASLGKLLSRLHATTGAPTGARYGWHEDYAFGAVVIENDPAETWPDFWAERRLRTHLRHVPADLGRRVEAIASRLADRLPAHPPASLLHGDLWSGNVLAAGGQVTALIDPACYYGHAEVDLAMLNLFGRIPPAFERAYGPVEPGRAERQPIYQLWPALVHLRLFGSTYAPLVDRLLQDAA